MNIIAVYDVGKDIEEAAKTLAAVFGKTAYEMRLRLLVSETEPLVVALILDKQKAEETVAALTRKGVNAFVLSKDEIELDKKRFFARTFELNNDFFRVESRQGQNIDLNYSSIKTMLFGSSISVHSEKEVVKDKKFSIGRTLMTQGLIRNKTVKRQVRTDEQTRERFLHIFSPDCPTVVLKENSLLYNSLGREMQATRAANFTYLVKELKKRSPGANFNDRLLSRSGQSQMLGAMLTPEEHLDIAITLLARYYDFTG